MSLLLKLTLLMAIILQLSCTEAPSPTLRLGTNIWPGYEPLYLARHQGYLQDEKIHLVEFSSSSQSIQAFRNNLIDAAALTLDEVLLLLESGEQLNVVLVMDISDGGDAIIGHADINLLKDIRDKRVGVENNALGAYVITRALEQINLDNKDVKIVPLDANEQENAFLEHRVDAVVTFEPVRSKLLKAGGHVLFDSRDIPGEIVDVLVVRSDFLNKHRDTVQYLLDGWYQTLAFMQDQPREAARILGVRMKLSIDDTLASYNGLKLPDQKENQQLIQTPELKLLASAKKMVQLMFKQGLLKQNIDPAIMFSDTGLHHK